MTGMRSILALSESRTDRALHLSGSRPAIATRAKPGAKGGTAWSIFLRSTKYFGASKASFMVNYRVDNLDGLLEELKKAGVEIDPHREDADYGRFAWIMDPDGNRIELWEAPKEN